MREADRQAFFETCLRYRRRERLMWMDTPIAKVFTEEDDWGLLKARALVQQVSQALLERRLKLDQAFERFDVNQDGLLSKVCPRLSFFFFFFFFFFSLGVDARRKCVQKGKKKFAVEHRNVGVP